MQPGTHLKRRSFSPFRTLFAGVVPVAGLALLVAWIAGGGDLAHARDATAEAPEGWELSGEAERARATYDQYCTTCHGPQGKGDGVMSKFLEPKPKDLTNREYMESRSDYQIYLAIKKGGAAVGLSDKMAPWEHLLGEQEIRDLTLLVRRLSRGE